MKLRYLDQTGLLLMLGAAYTWFRRGSGLQLRIPTRWSSLGKLNLIGSYVLHDVEEFLEVRELTGTCNQTQVIAYLDSIASTCTPEMPTTVVLDNAPFHKGAEIKKKRPEWEKQGLTLYYLPAYSPHLNLIEEIWRRLKGFLMPRRCYNSLAELKEALLTALQAIGARFI